jgi:hypothetical protein
MTVGNFGIVIAGITVPASEFDLSHYRFRHHPLKEVFRAPVAVQAEAPGLALQILPDRCEVVVTAPGDLEEDAREVTSIANTVFEYVGERVVKAVGHNMQYVVDGVSGRKLESVGRFLQVDAANHVLDRPIADADVTLYFHLHNESVSRVAIMSQADPSRLVLDFNVNFDRDALSARAAVDELGASVARLTELARRLSDFLSGGEAAE